jgi:hypothetical protein
VLEKGSPVNVGNGPHRDNGEGEEWPSPLPTHCPHRETNVKRILSPSVRLESLTYAGVRLESLTYAGVRLESLTYASC